MNVREQLFGFGAEPRFRGHLRRLDLGVETGDRDPVSERDLDGLPEPAQRYLRFMGVVGRPRDWSFKARFTGEFRMRRGQPWMPFSAWQYNSSSPVARVTDMRADLAGLVPMYGSDSYVAGRGRMSGRVLGLVPVVDGAGVEFDLGEFVTWVNDAALIAPSMLLTPNTEWWPVNDSSFAVEVTDCGNTVTSTLTVDAEGRLLEFRTSDRWYAGVDPPVRTPWATPIDGWTTVGGRPIPTAGAACWQFPDGEFCYVRGRWLPETIEFDVGPAVVARHHTA